MTEEKFDLGSLLNKLAALTADKPSNVHLQVGPAVAFSAATVHSGELYGTSRTKAICHLCGTNKTPVTCANCRTAYYTCCSKCCSKCLPKCEEFDCATCHKNVEINCACKEKKPCCNTPNCNCCFGMSQKLCEFREKWMRGQEPYANGLDLSSICFTRLCPAPEGKVDMKLTQVASYCLGKEVADVLPPLNTPLAMQHSLCHFGVTQSFSVAKAVQNRGKNPYLSFVIPFYAYSEQLGFGKPDPYVVKNRLFTSYATPWDDQHQRVLDNIPPERREAHKKWYGHLKQKHHVWPVNMKSQLCNVAVPTSTALQLDICLATPVSNRSSLVLELDPTQQVGSILTGDRIVERITRAGPIAVGETEKSDWKDVVGIDMIENRVHHACSSYTPTSFDFPPTLHHEHQWVTSTTRMGMLQNTFETPHFESSLHNCFRREMAVIANLQPGGFDQFDSTLTEMERAGKLEKSGDKVLIDVTPGKGNRMSSLLAYAMCRNMPELASAAFSPPIKSTDVYRTMFSTEKERRCVSLEATKIDAFIRTVQTAWKISHLANLSLIEMRVYPIGEDLSEMMDLLQKAGTFHFEITGNVCPIRQEAVFL